MILKDFLAKIKIFLIKRVTELFGLIILLLSLSILISLITYSPNDPNFIIAKESQIENLLGLRGSIVSDFLFQSIGLIAYLIPITLFFSGLKVITNKESLVFIDSLFYSVIYIITGTLFFSYFKDQSFFLTVNHAQTSCIFRS